MRAPKFHPGPFTYHQEIELEIGSIANSGAGVGRVDGWVVFVPFVLPGELVVARIWRNAKQYSEADLVRVLKPSPERIAPRCPLFGTCGGCQYQHASYATQLDIKRRQVAELLEHLARLPFPVDPVVPSPSPYAYRSKITPHFAKPRDGQIAEIGFLRHGRKFDLVDVLRCEIATEAVNTHLAQVRLQIQQNPSRWKKGGTALVRETALGVLTDPKVDAIEKVGALELSFTAGGFFQNNPFLLPALVSHVVSEAASFGATRLVDAYCGCGLFALSAAAHFPKIEGVEVSQAAVERARLNAARNHITHARFLAADASAIFTSLGSSGSDSVVILDPPRAGCGQPFLEQLADWRPQGILYVSCNPATQMRDLTFLRERGFELVRVRPFDMFPQTKHLECVMTLKQTGSAL